MKKLTLTEKIDNAFKLSADLYNQIVDIEQVFKHPLDNQETCTDIHNIQNRLLSIAYRNNLKLNTELI